MEPMKRLLIILQDLNGGGAEKMMVRLASALTDAGNDVTLLMLTGAGVNSTHLDPRVRQVQLHSARSSRAVPALARFLRRNRFDAQLAASPLPRCQVPWRACTSVSATRFLMTNTSTPRWRYARPICWRRCCIDSSPIR
jgi:hypothetical protein